MSTEKRYKYIVDLLLQSQGFSNNATKVQSQIKGVETAAKRTRTVLLEMAGALGFTYGIGQMTQLVQQTVQLAAKAEGVKAAFSKLDKPGLLNELQRATSGTVSNLELMTKAVQARNFKISMEALPTYFKFATNRALETGQAVDYLVESLVVGVGRKSVLWLDNLGLSVVEINEELKKTPDFAEAVGKVIEREMKAAGTVADTTATKIQGITASWENLKLTMGESILGKGGSVGMGILSDWLDMLSAPDITGGQKLGNWIDTLIGGDKTQEWKENKKAAEEYFAALDKANTMRYIMTYSKELEKLDEQGKYLLNLAIARYKEIKATEEGNDKKEKELRTLESLNTEINMYNELVLKTPLADKATIKSHLENIKKLEEEKKAIMELADARRELVEGPGKVSTSNLILPTFGSKVSGKLAGPPSSEAEMIKRANEELEKQKELVSELENVFYNMFMSIDDGIAGMAQSLIRSIEMIAAQLAAKAVVFGLLSLLFPGSTLVAGGIGAFLGMGKSLVPGLADGGIAFGPTIAQVGEYPGASSNPEVIAPLSKLSQMLQPAGIGGEVIFRIGERELVGVLVKSQRVTRNIRGKG
jgi:hypothetical protein